jgi:MFS family permease
VFQLGVAVFIVGSFFCGLANSMVLLTTFRAVQGLGEHVTDDEYRGR